MAKAPSTETAPPAMSPLGTPESDTECAQLRIRIVALENLFIALLAQAPAQQLALATAMACHISPRPGFTAHRLTLHAAAEMRSLVRRAARFRVKQLSGATEGQV
jgi:hypothetical protein